MGVRGFDLAFFGGLRQDYLITADNRVYEGLLGGNAVYAAVGALCWDTSVGLVARVGENFPAHRLALLDQAGIDTRAVRVIPERLPMYTFYAYLSHDERMETNPAAHFLRVGHRLPKELIGHQAPELRADSLERYSPQALRPDDLDDSLAHCVGAHFSPAEYLTHLAVPLRMRQMGIPMISLEPRGSYMEPRSRDLLGQVLSGIDVFLPSEKDMRVFFRSESMDLWEMAESLGSMGCPYVVVKRGVGGQYIWEAQAKRRWIIPAYPARVVDVTGAGSAFCGGFLAGMTSSGDVVEAALMGSVSASLTVEGVGALFALDALPGLAQARLEALRAGVKRV